MPDVTTKGSRYQRGIKSPRPEVAQRIRDVLAADPSISKSELARRVGLSRSALGYYMRSMTDAVRTAADANDAVKHRAALSQLDLVQRVADAADEVKVEIDRLRSSGTGNPAATFRGFSVLGQLYRLLGELLGEIGPQENLYLVQVQALLQRPVSVADLSPTARAVLGDGSDGTPAAR